MNAILTMSAFLFPLVTFPYASRVLGAEGVGKAGFATSFAAYFVMAAQLGIPTYGIKACAAARDDREELSRTAMELLMLGLAAAAVSCLVYGICMFKISKLRQDPILYAIAGSSIVFNAIGMEWLYKGIEKYSYITGRSLACKAVSVICLFLLVRGPENYREYALVTIFAASASYMLNLWNSRKLIAWQWRGHYGFRRHIRPVMVFFFLVCTTTIYTNLDTVMLGFIKTDAEVGYYQAAVKVKSILVSMVTSLGAVLLPRCSYYAEKGFMEEFWRVSKKALHFVLLASVPLCVFFIMKAEDGILLLCGKDFYPSTLPMRIIMPTLVLIGITNILGMEIMVPTGREKLVLYSTVVGALTDLLLNAIWIQPYGAAGAALATLFAETAVLLIQAWFLRKELGKLTKRAHYEKILAAAVAAAAILMLCNGILIRAVPSETSRYAFIRLAASAAVYFLAYIGMLLLLKEQSIWDIVHAICQGVGKRYEAIRQYAVSNYESFTNARQNAGVLYLTGLALYLAEVIYDTTMFPQLGLERYLLLGPAVALVCLKMLLFDTWSVKHLLGVLFCLGAALAGFTQSRDLIFVYWFIFMFGAQGIAFEDILKVYLIVLGSIMFYAFAACRLGILEDVGEPRMIMGFEIEGHSFGIVNTTDFAAHICYGMMAYYGIRKGRIGNLGFIISLLITAAVFLKTHGRCDTLCMLILIFLYAADQKCSRMKWFMKVWRGKLTKYILAAIIPAMAFVTIFLSNIYQDGIRVLFEIDKISSNRYSLAKKSYLEYPVKLFGQKIVMYGNGREGRAAWAEGAKYTFIDLSYNQLLLIYGAVMFVIVMMVFVVGVCRLRDRHLVYLMLIVGLNSMLAHHMFELGYDIFPLMFFAQHTPQYGAIQGGIKRRSFG